MQRPALFTAGELYPNEPYKHFLFFLNEHGIQSYDSITPAYLSDYVKTFVNLKNKSVRATLVAMRCFLRHLYLNGFIQQNLEDMLPKLKDYYAPSIPRIWKPSEVKTVLDTIDRGNPTGKRDYAMLLLIARLGLRASDLKAICALDPEEVFDYVR